MSEARPSQEPGMNRDFNLGEHIQRDLENDDDVMPKAVFAAKHLDDHMKDLEYQALESTAQNQLLERRIDELLDPETVKDATHRELIEKAMRDDLTGVYNRRGLRHQYRALTHESSLRRRDKPPTHAVLFIDLDKLKAINDSPDGHAGGDKALQSVAKELTDGTRPDDIVGRYGGDEFIVFLRHISLEDAADRAEALRAAAEAAGNTVSIGVGLVNPTLSFETTYKESNQAMYKAKEKGRNQVMVFSDPTELEAPPPQPPDHLPNP